MSSWLDLCLCRLIYFIDKVPTNGVRNALIKQKLLVNVLLWQISDAVGSTYIAKRKEKEAGFVFFGKLLKAGDLILLPVITFEFCSN